MSFQRKATLRLRLGANKQKMKFAFKNSLRGRWMGFDKRA